MYITMVRMMEPMQKNVVHQSLLPKASSIPPQYRAILEQFEEKQASIKFRHDMLLRQRNSNYVNEHNRITGILDGIVHGLPETSTTRLRYRQQQLQRLAEKGLYQSPAPFGDSIRT